MTQTRFLKTTGAITAFAAIIVAGMVNSSKRVTAQDDTESRIQRGFDIAPVPLTLQGKTGRWWVWVAILSTLWAIATAVTRQAQLQNLSSLTATPISFPLRLAEQQR